MIYKDFKIVDIFLENEFYEILAENEKRKEGISFQLATLDGLRDSLERNVDIFLNDHNNDEHD